MATTTCARCERELPPDDGVPVEARIPCPDCGSTSRNYSIHLSGSVFAISGAIATLTVSETSLLLQAVFTPGERTDDGQLIEAVSLPWFDIVAKIGNDPSIAFEIPPRKWEEIIAGAYKRAGFDEVILTPASGDFGRDVIAVKHGLGKVRIIDQVKAYKPGHLVTANDVRALLGVLEADGASKGFVTTTSDFAPTLRNDRLIKPLIPTRIDLVNGETLLNRLQSLAVSSKK